MTALGHAATASIAFRHALISSASAARVYSAAQMINDDRDAGAAVCQIRQARQAREVGRPVVVAQVILLQPRKPRKKGLV